MAIKIKFDINSPIYLSEFLQQNSFSDSLLSKMKQNQNSFMLNNQVVTLNQFLNINDHLIITLPAEKTNINLIDGTLDIIYEDPYILIINKPHNLAVIGTKAHYDYHLAGMILKYYQQQDIKATIHYVNRLDKDTAGLILVAKHQYIHALLSTASIVKKYHLLCQGIIEQKAGVLAFPLQKDSTYRSTKYLVSQQGKEAKTAYQVINYLNGNSVVEAKLLTGKTHQIRVHFAFINHPLVGDRLYGNANENDYLHLQSYYLAFKHPLTHEYLTFTLPAES